MEKEWILVMDSGIGGKWTLDKIKEILPNENYLFFMDKIHAPYGNKSKRKLLKICEENVEKFLMLYKIKLVVIACNTLSSICFDRLKEKFAGVSFVKIEPYFDPKLFGGLPTLLLATNATIKHNKKIKEYKNYSNIYQKSFGNLAKKIDDTNGKFQLLDDFLAKKLKKYVKKGIKNIILGCTHYNHIKPNLTKIFGDVAFFENSENVAKTVFDTLCVIKKLSKQKIKGDTFVLYKI